MTEEAMQRLEDKSAFYQAALIESQMYARFGALMEEFDVLACPTVLTNRMAADFNPVKGDYIVTGEVKESTSPCPPVTSST